MPRRIDWFAALGVTAALATFPAEARPRGFAGPFLVGFVSGAAVGAALAPRPRPVYPVYVDDERVYVDYTRPVYRRCRIVKERVYDGVRVVDKRVETCG